jgi:hypothetical protein
MCLDETIGDNVLPDARGEEMLLTTCVGAVTD